MEFNAKLRSSFKSMLGAFECRLSKLGWHVCGKSHFKCQKQKKEGTKIHLQTV